MDMVMDMVMDMAMDMDMVIMDIMARDLLSQDMDIMAMDMDMDMDMVMAMVMDTTAKQICCSFLEFSTQAQTEKVKAALVRGDSFENSKPFSPGSWPSLSLPELSSQGASPPSSSARSGGSEAESIPNNPLLKCTIC